MRDFTLSAKAELDLDEIAAYTRDNWGEEQLDRYLSELEDCFALLAQFSGMGRRFGAIGKGLRRHELGRHVIFYRETEGGVRILRVLHRSRLPWPDLEQGSERL